MTAEKAKLMLMEYYLGYSMPCMTEMQLWGMYRADIVAVEKDLTFREIEIKVNTDDLMGELRSIQKVKKKTKPDNNCKKYTKHQVYLNNTDGLDLIPNKFYFAVPEGLIKEAEKGIKKTPYGLILLPSDQYGIFQPVVVVRAKSIHDNKLDDLFKFLMRASRENFREMNKLN